MALFPNGILLKTPLCTDPPKYSLLSVVNSVNPSDPHWMAGGVEWEDDLCGNDLVAFIDECLPTSGTGTGFEKPAVRGLTFCHSDPFVAVGSYDCTPVGRPAGEAFEIARRRLLAWESHQVEETLWTGVVANGAGFNNPSFAFGNTDCDIAPEDLTPGGPQSIVASLARLEEALGDIVSCGGIIHVPYRVLTFMTRYNLIREIDGVYYTATGNKVIAGHGYDGSGPANVPAGANTQWIFATGPLLLVRGNVIMVPDMVKEAVDRSINNVTVRAERVYSVGFSCTLLAIEVDLCDVCD